MSRVFLIVVCALASVAGAFSQSAGDPNDGARLRRDGATIFLSWFAATGRTYFLQHSEDLLTWTYFPPEDIVTGSDEVPEICFPVTGPTPFFLRLKSVPITSPFPLSADFDGDKINNFNEMVNGLDPLHTADGDGDGIPNDWETWYGLNPGDPADATIDWDGDGQSNLVEFQTGASTDPTDYYNGNHPDVRIVGGYNQTNEPGTFSTMPLVIELKYGALPLVNGPVTVWLGDPAAGRISLTNDGTGLATTLSLHTGPDGLIQVWFRHSDVIPPAATRRYITFNIGSLTTSSKVRFDFLATTRKIYTYPPGTLGLHASQAIDTRIAGKNPATALPIFSTQNHLAVPPTYVRNTACWCYDLAQAMTCISPFSSHVGIQYGGTAITPQHIITSAHIDFIMQVDDTIRFITANNVVVTKTIRGKAQHPNYQPYYPDLTVYTLDSPLPATITPCKMLPANYDLYLSDVERHRPPVLVLNQFERARVYDLIILGNSAIDPRFTAGATQPTLAPDREAFYEGGGSGDSGNPVFLIVNNSLVLLTTQTNVAGGTFVTPQISALNAMIAAADAHATSRGYPVNSGLQVQTIDLSGFNQFTPP